MKKYLGMAALVVAWTVQLVVWAVVAAFVALLVYVGIVEPAEFLKILSAVLVVAIWVGAHALSRTYIKSRKERR